MVTEKAGDEGEGTVRYRIVVGSELGPEWMERLGAHTLQTGHDETIMEVRIVDEAHLQALLRQLYDLNLRLRSVCRITAG